MKVFPGLSSIAALCREAAGKDEPAPALAAAFAGGQSAGTCAGPSVWAARGCAGRGAGSSAFQHPVIAPNGPLGCCGAFGARCETKAAVSPVRKDSMAPVPTRQCQPSQLGQTPVAITRHVAYLTLPASLALSCRSHQPCEQQQLFAVVFIHLHVVALAGGCNRRAKAFHVGVQLGAVVGGSEEHVLEPFLPAQQIHAPSGWVSDPSLTSIRS